LSFCKPILLQNVIIFTYMQVLSFRKNAKIGQLEDLRGPHFRRHLRQEPYINKYFFFIRWPFISAHPTTL